MENDWRFFGYLSTEPKEVIIGFRQDGTAIYKEEGEEEC